MTIFKFKAGVIVCQSMPLMALISYLLITICGESNSEYNSMFTKRSFFKKRLYPGLPTVTISSEFVVKKNSTAWILNIPQNSIENDLVHVNVAWSYPFSVFFFADSNTTQQRYSYWISRREVNEKDIFDRSSHNFIMEWYVYFSHLQIKNNISLEFRSTTPPFLGISLRCSLNMQTGIAVFQTSTLISDPFKAYFRSIQSKMQNETCDAYFFVEQSFDFQSRTPLSGYSCVFADKQKGVTTSINYFVDQVMVNYEINRKNCWTKRDLCGKNSPCDSTKHRNLFNYFFPSMIAFCRPEATNEEQTERKEISSTPIFARIAEPEQNKIPEIYFTNEEIKASSMISMKPFKEFHHLDTKLTVTCRIVPAYAALPIRFGAKAKFGDKIIYFPVIENTMESPKYNWELSTYQIDIEYLRLFNIESIFCFAPVRGSYDWINASRPVSVQKFFIPMFINNTKYTASLEKIVTTVERTFLIGSKKESISCDAIGFPRPSISWTRNNIPVEATEDKSLPGLIRSSVVVFEEIDKTTEGVYICKAKNSLGEAQLLYKLVVKDNTRIILAVSITVPVIAIFLISSFIIALIWKRRMQHRFEVPFLTDQEVGEFINGHQKKYLRGPNESILGRPFNPKHIILGDTLKFDRRHILGSGNSGLVLNGWICTDEAALIQTAIKTTKHTADILHFKALLSEVKISSYLTGHPNIVQFYGACIENIKNGEIYAAYEFCQQGDLLAVLRKIKSDYENTDDFTRSKFPNNLQKTTCIETLIKWSRDIAVGMEFLHSQNVIHGDLAARNILLTKSNVAKISDFGLSRQLLNDYLVYQKKTKVALPWKWMAPESLLDSKFSIHSDVWSFGITLWEIFSFGDPPFPGQRCDADFIKHICEGTRPIKPKSATTEIYKIMLRCWEKDPESRPSIVSIAREIEEFILNVVNESVTNYALI